MVELQLKIECSSADADGAKVKVAFATPPQLKFQTSSRFLSDVRYFDICMALDWRNDFCWYAKLITNSNNMKFELTNRQYNKFYHDFITRCYVDKGPHDSVVLLKHQSLSILNVYCIKKLLNNLNR